MGAEADELGGPDAGDGEPGADAGLLEVAGVEGDAADRGGGDELDEGAA